MPADTAGYINPPQASLHLEDVLASFRDEEGNELGEEEAKDVQELLKVGEPAKLPKWRAPFRIRKLPPGFVAPGSVNPPKLREVQFGRYIGPDGQEVTMEDEEEESEEEDDYEDDEEEVRAQTPRDRAYQRVEEEEEQQKRFVEEYDDEDNEVDDEKD